MGAKARRRRRRLRIRRAIRLEKARAQDAVLRLAGEPNVYRCPVCGSKLYKRAPVIPGSDSLYCPSCEDPFGLMDIPE